MSDSDPNSIFFFFALELSIVNVITIFREINKVCTRIETKNINVVYKLFFFNFAYRVTLQFNDVLLTIVPLV